MITDQYHEFLNNRSQDNTYAGFDPHFLPDFFYDHQRFLVDWSLRKGKSAIFADCGLGKTPMALVWAQNVHMHTNGRVLILTPLAVGAQFKKEAEKFGIDADRSSGDITNITSGIIITNYEKLKNFDPKDFVGCVCDESSILKNFSGARKTEITVFMRKMKYRLLATATAAPNDFHELGTSSEALGYLGYMDMLNKFFKNDLNNSATGRFAGSSIKWRLKGHAERHFWRWVCSWSRSIRKPSDLGFDDNDFILPPLNENVTVVSSTLKRDDVLFDMPAVGLKEQREERRRSLNDRCEKISEISSNINDQSIIWCHLNDEGNKITEMLDDCVQVSGSDSEEAKEEKLLGFQSGHIKRLVTKPKIGAWGLNFQNCHDVLTFPSHSFEQYYQSVRRCWRFGQKHQVNVNIVASEGECDVLKNLQRKQMQTEQMFSNLVEEMKNELSIVKNNDHVNNQELPSWL